MNAALLSSTFQSRMFLLSSTRKTGHKIRRKWFVVISCKQKHTKNACPMVNCFAFFVPKPSVYGHKVQNIVPKSVYNIAGFLFVDIIMWSTTKKMRRAHVPTACKVFWRMEWWHIIYQCSMLLYTIIIYHKPNTTQLLDMINVTSNDVAIL